MPSVDTSLILYILIGLIITLIIWVIRLEMRLHKLLMGKTESLEDSIMWLKTNFEGFAQFKEECIEYFKNIEGRLKRSIQSVETIRFNPFKGTGSGGNQSFATAFMNEKGDGVVISSLYSRDRVSVFSKPVKKFSSEFELTAEEKKVVQNSKESVTVPK